MAVGKEEWEITAQWLQNYCLGWYTFGNVVIIIEQHRKYNETHWIIYFKNDKMTNLIYIIYIVYAQLCPNLGDPMDCSPPASSIHGIFQARILEWVAISYSRASAQPRDPTCVSCVSCIGRWISLPLYHVGRPYIITIKRLIGPRPKWKA